MKKITYNKLIRDRIGEIIQADGKKPKISILDDNDYLIELKKKVVEEAKELQSAAIKSDILGELSDLQELIDVILQTNNISKQELEQSQSDKRQKRGSFDKKLFLEYVEDDLA